MRRQPTWLLGGICLLATHSASLTAQAAHQVLTLADAEARALKNEPRLTAESLRVQALSERIKQDRACYLPHLIANATAVQANDESTVAAGAITTSSVSKRVAAGVTFTQLLTDFGRTRDLVRSSRLTAEAALQNTENTKQEILLDVDDAYFSAEAAENVSTTAQAVLDFRKTELRQLNALTQSQLRSTLDQQFAQVLVSDAQMAVVKAHSRVLGARAQLAAAMGEDDISNESLMEPAQPPLLEADVTPYLTEAIATRPDLKALQLQANAAQQYAHAESKLNYPAAALLGSAGEVPVRDRTLQQNYGAAGINISVPVFYGRFYSSRAKEAKLRALASERDMRERTLLIERDVRTHWAQARDAYLQIEVARDLVDQTAVALHLAQARYDAGLGSIVELSQAELSHTSALIDAAGARFEYLTARAALNYAVGVRP